MTSVNNWIDNFLKDMSEKQGCSDNTRAAYRSDLVQYSHYLQTKESVSSWDKVTDVQTAKFIYWLKDRQESPATLARKAVSIRRFHRFLIRNHLLERDPSVMIDAPRITPKPPLILTVGEVERLLEKPRHSDKPNWRDAAMLELLYATGMRATELINLKRGDLNLELGFVRCRTGRGRERVVPVGEPAKQVLGRYLEESERNGSEIRSDQPLFPNRRNARMTRQSVWKMMKTYAQQTGLRSGLSPETLRNSLIAHLFERGADPESVDELMGRSASAGSRRFPLRRKETLRQMYGHCHPRARFKNQ
ncbi:tyrosine-type recombinase/integrase [Sporolactobacillus vineae]|uniref:tyrosine-type recombinase/integrase n=1 Tax=Sporolactobacillus vineae TaxID=444463 RepID=UPI0002881228|nr:tyrosine-type recombinase/integrase [Sporolactobacillus vineae]